MGAPDRWCAGRIAAKCPRPGRGTVRPGLTRITCNLYKSSFTMLYVDSGSKRQFCGCACRGRDAGARLPPGPSGTMGRFTRSCRHVRFFRFPDESARTRWSRKTEGASSPWRPFSWPHSANARGATLPLTGRVARHASACRAGWGEATRGRSPSCFTPTPSPSPRHGEAMLRMPYLSGRCELPTLRVVPHTLFVATPH